MGALTGGRALGPAALAILAGAMPALAETTRLPAAMLGVWAPDAADCRDEAGTVKDSRVEVTGRSVDFFASSWSVRAWERSGETYRGRARVAEEGEDRPAPGRARIALALTPDGRLRVRLERAEPEVFVKCPPGVLVR